MATINRTISTNDFGITAYYGGSNFQNPVVETPTGVIYAFYIDLASDLVYVKSTDGGVTFGSAVVIRTGTVIHFTTWADWWSGITATSYIHIVYTDSGNDDTMYRYLDITTDTLGTERTVFAGSSATLGSAKISVTRARGGNLVVYTDIDGGTEYDTVKSSNLFVSKTSISELFEAYNDTYLLMPGWATDTNDVMCFFLDASANELSVKFYDDSANSWSETSLATSVLATTPYNLSGCVDIANSRNIISFWTGYDSAGADLRCWQITEATQTEVTNIILDSVDDQGLCALIIDSTSGKLTCFYKGKSDGSEDASYGTFLYFKESTDFGTTWGSETKVESIPKELLANWVKICPLVYQRVIIFLIYVSNLAFWSINIPSPMKSQSDHGLGI